MKFMTTPLSITEEAKRAAKEVLCPPSARRTGEEEDIFSNRSYQSLQGQTEKVYLYVGPGTLKFKIIPEDISEETEICPKALCPPSPDITAEEDFFSEETSASKGTP
ncbi:hypothetical protein G5714_002757 [Onychostoma macrolepis]|uniref:Uncharacterized protein n=1 Tax=Onychostoma macrolepis TaxID=369639 RepID=A0A7J6D7K0_9TELE|nr:hypothetical protein G5714_002757 [Onychostoma macrolepis]